MELGYDWKNFQTVFFPKKRIVHSEVTPKHSIFLIMEGRVVVSAFSEAEDLSDWLGATLDELKAEYPHRDLIAYTREDFDRSLSDLPKLAHYYDQIQHLRTQLTPSQISEPKTSKNQLTLEKHFLLSAIQTWWKTFFPMHYGIYISIEGQKTVSFLLKINRGRVDSFLVPDFSSLPPEKRKSSNEQVKFLSEHYLVPVQGFYVNHSEWSEWVESENPWPKMVAAFKANRNKLVPFNWGLAALIASRAYLGF